ncbi:MarR family transcriptional regulator [Zoogloea sp.]|uniref:MarR family winged helix-turn-helix transcriptional regulator n=1 Tax=Zoogloea sp. TaxID=49181 RepID=UPI001416DB21|nr:MAG: MarR family transcriptional regulator [Zoogloea sp.]
MIDLNRQTELRESIELFFFAYRAFTAPPDRILADRGLGRVHHRILYFVGRQPGTTVTELLGTLGVTKQALNAPLRQLVEVGLIGTTADPDDKRVKRLALTADGAALEAELTGTQLAMLEKLFDKEGRDAELAWKRLMDGLRQA